MIDFEVYSPDLNDLDTILAIYLNGSVKIDHRILIFTAFFRFLGIISLMKIKKSLA